MTREQAYGRQLAERSCRAQGLSLEVSDAAVLRRLAPLFRSPLVKPRRRAS